MSVPSRAEVVVAGAGPAGRSAAIPGLVAPAPRSVTTHLHVLPASPRPPPLIVLGASGGRLVDSPVLIDAQPACRPDGRARVAGSSLDPTAGGTCAPRSALPVLRLRQPVDLCGGRLVRGDHRDSTPVHGTTAGRAGTARAALRFRPPTTQGAA